MPWLLLHVESDQHPLDVPRIVQEHGSLPGCVGRQLVNDGGLFLPDERVNLADLCLRYSKDEDAFLELTLYMCKEYILDRRRYYDLMTTVASRMGEIHFERKAWFLVQDAAIHVWKLLPELRNCRKLPSRILRRDYCRSSPTASRPWVTKHSCSCRPIRCPRGAIRTCCESGGRLLESWQRAIPQRRQWLQAELVQAELRRHPADLDWKPNLKVRTERQQ